MFKILNLLVISFFFLIIFSFSHIFYLFGYDIIIDIFGRGGYEGIKSSIVLIYGFLFGVWTFIYLLRYKLYKNDYKVFKVLGSILFLMTISTILSVTILGSIIGISEKYHGLLFFISLITFFSSIYFGFDKKDYKRSLNYIFIFSLFVYLYGIFQFIGHDSLSIFYETRVLITRASSFFGNANYLAGYILILLPLLKYINNTLTRRGFFVISYIILFLTGSYFGIFLGIIYLLFLIYNYNKNIFILLLTIFIISSAYLLSSIGVEKKGSMLARPYIWQSTFNAIIDSPKTIMFGYGPDTLHLVFNKFKVPELSIYEDSKYTADRSHNIFLDFIYFFGIFGGIFIIYFILKGFQNSKNKEIRWSIFLFFLFFSFNVPVSIHFVLILFLLAGVYSKSL